MLHKEDFMMIQALAQRELYLCDIATQVDMHPWACPRCCAIARSEYPWVRPRLKV